MGKIIHFDEFRAGASEQRALRVRRSFANARGGMLEFKHQRDRIRDEAKALSSFFREEGEQRRPEDFDLRVSRVCLAMYLVEALDRMATVADSKHDLQNAFESARKALRELLGDSYFSLGEEALVYEYSKCEPAIRHCASRCGIRLLDPEPAVEATKMRLAEMIDEINEI